MTITISDPELIKALESAEDPNEFKSPERRTVRVVNPRNKYALPPGFVPPISEDEIEERRKNVDGRPLGDFFRELEAKHG
jgi:hypothetical protein